MDGTEDTCALTGQPQRRCRCEHCCAADDVDALLDEDAVGFRAREDDDLYEDEGGDEWTES